MRDVREIDYTGSERLTMNMGPQHPSAHGVFRAAWENILKAEALRGTRGAGPTTVTPTHEDDPSATFDGRRSDGKPLDRRWCHTGSVLAYLRASPFAFDWPFYTHKVGGF